MSSKSEENLVKKNDQENDQENDQKSKVKKNWSNQMITSLNNNNSKSEENTNKIKVSKYVSFIVSNSNA